MNVKMGALLVILFNLVVTFLSVAIVVLIVWAVASLAVSIAKVASDQCGQQYVIEKRLLIEGEWLCVDR